MLTSIPSGWAGGPNVLPSNVLNYVPSNQPTSGFHFYSFLIHDSITVAIFWHIIESHLFEILKVYDRISIYFTSSYDEPSIALQSFTCSS